MLLKGTGSAVLDMVGLFSTGLTSYARALIRPDDKAWLLQNCMDTLLFCRMRAHTTVCSDEEVIARVGACCAALKEVTQGSSSLGRGAMPLPSW